MLRGRHVSWCYFTVAALVGGACSVRQDLGRLPGADASASPDSGVPTFPGTTSRAGWRWISPFPTGDDLRAAVGMPSAEMLLLGANDTILRRGADGRIREVAEPSSDVLWYSGSATAGDDVWLIGERRRASEIRRFDGTAWTSDYSLGQFPIHAVTAANRDLAWAGVGIFGSMWNGAEWLTIAADTTAPLRALHSTGPNDTWAVGDRGTLVHWEDGGFRDVRPVTPGAVYARDRNYVAVWGAARDDVWAAYEAETRDEVGFVRFDGTRWEDTPPLAAACKTRPDTKDPWMRGARMAGTSATRIVAILGQGCTFSYDGEAWSLRSTVESPSLDVVIASVAASGSDLLAVGERGALLRFDERATPPWTSLFPALREDLAQVRLLDAEPWALAPSGIVRLVDGRWENVPSTEGTTAFTFDGTRALWFARLQGPTATEIVRRRASVDEVVAHLEAKISVIAERDGVFWLGGDGGFAARGDGRSFTSLGGASDFTVTAVMPTDRDTAIFSRTKALGEERFARVVERLSTTTITTLVTDESGSALAPIHVAGARIWVGGLPLLRVTDGEPPERVSIGDDSPVDSITAAGGETLWLAGGGVIRYWNGNAAQRVFGTGRHILALTSSENVAWAVGESGATLAFLPAGASLR